MESSYAIRRIREAGEEMFEKYCQKRERSFMFPLAPKSKYVDKFPDNITTNASIPKREKSEFDQQTQYESEVMVYKFLEDLTVTGGLIVFHGFSYTHKQFSLFVRGHSDSNKCKRLDHEEEGECDFLLIHPKFLAILEVKAPNFDACKNADNTFKRNYSDSKKQRQRTRDLIYGISKRMKVTTPDIEEFTVFSSIVEKEVADCPSYMKLPPDEKKRILFMSDFKDPGSNLIQRLQDVRLDMTVDVNDRLRSILLGLWYFDDIKESKNSMNVDLSTTINDLDYKLKTMKISRKEQPSSSLVVTAPACLRKLNIKFITKCQKAVLTNGKHKLWVNGPAGSGKTLLIMGKVIKLLEESEKRIFVIVPNEIVARNYQQLLEGANVESICYNFVNEPKLEEDTKSNSRLFFVHYNVKMGMQGMRTTDDLNRLELITKIQKTDSHIFIDDFHSMTASIGFNAKTDICNIVFDEMNSNSPRIFWVTYDILQDGFLSQYTRTGFAMKEIIHKITDKDCFQSLPAVLRNSRQIADLLSSLRKFRLEHEKLLLEEHKKDSSMIDKIPSDRDYEDFYSFMSLDQEIGHFIHGPKPICYMLSSHWSNGSAFITKIREILKAELLKLDSTDTAIIVDQKIAAHQGPWKMNFTPSSRGIKTSSINPNNIRPELPEDVINWKSECEKIISDFSSTTSMSQNSNFTVHHFNETFSAEWPAVIGVVEFSRKMFSKENWVLGSPSHVLSNDSDLMDQLLSKIYITASRARVYFCLILVMRDFDIYLDTKRHFNSCRPTYLNPKPRFVSEIIKKTQDEIKEEFSDLFKTLSNHVIEEGRYICKTKTDKKMKDEM